MSGEQQEKSEAAAAATTVQSSILDQVIKATRPQDQADADRVKDYFKQFLDRVIQPGQVLQLPATLTGSAGIVHKLIL